MRDFLPIGQDVPLVTFFGAKRHSQYLLADLWCEIVIIKIWWEIITICRAIRETNFPKKVRIDNNEFVLKWCK